MKICEEIVFKECFEVFGDFKVFVAASEEDFSVWRVFQLMWSSLTLKICAIC